MTTISAPTPLGVDFRNHPRRDSKQPGNPLREKSVPTRTVTTAGGVYAPGRIEEFREFGYPLLRLVVLVEFDTRAKPSVTPSHRPRGRALRTDTSPAPGDRRRSETRAESRRVQLACN
jgi:hypothetical protein